MLRRRQENPEEFEMAYHRRSLVESVFSSLKARFGAVVAAKTLPLQRLQLILRSICYNLLSYLNCMHRTHASALAHAVPHYPSQSPLGPLRGRLHHESPK